MTGPPAGQSKPEAAARVPSSPESLGALLEKGRRLGGFLRADTGLALTLGYVMLTLVGMAYLARFYAAFQINIFDYADAGDFLLAGLRDPLVMVFTLGPVPGAWLYMRLVGWFDRRTPVALRPMRWGNELWERTRRPLLLLLILTWTTAAVLSYARTSARRVHEGHGKAVVVEYMNTAVDTAGGPGVPARPLFLLGTTARYVFLFDPARPGAIIVPVGNVARIIVAPLPGRRHASPPGSGR